MGRLGIGLVMVLLWLSVVQGVWGRCLGKPQFLLALREGNHIYDDWACLEYNG
jgi:hypothetical protein